MLQAVAKTCIADVNSYPIEIGNINGF